MPRGKSRLVDQRRLRTRKRKRVLFLSFYALSLAVLSVTLLALALSLSPFFVSEIHISRTERTSATEIESIVREKLQGEYFWIFPRSNTLIYPHDEIERALRALPAVEDVDVSRRSLSGLIITIDPRDEIALWCDSGCYSVDETGFVFDESATSSDTFIYRGLLSHNPIGERLLDTKRFKEVAFFIRELSALDLAPREALFLDNWYMEVTIRDGGRLIVYLDDDLSSVLDIVRSVISDTRIAPSLEAFTATLEYLRLDAGSKVTYKRKD